MYSESDIGSTDLEFSKSSESESDSNIKSETEKVRKRNHKPT